MSKKYTHTCRYIHIYKYTYDTPENQPSARTIRLPQLGWKVTFQAGVYHAPTRPQRDRNPDPGSEPRARHLFGLAAFSAALQSAGCLRAVAPLAK